MRALPTALMIVGLAGCGSAPIRLHPPECTPAAARTMGTTVDLDPISKKVGGDPMSVPVPIAPPGAEAVITSGMSSELRARALRGGEPGGYVVRCTLDRFAIRWRSDVSSSHALSTLYIDLACEASRARDRAPVWRGELRGRAAATSASLFAGDAGTMQTRADRMLGDAAREMASDLAVRALGLAASPSARVFRNEAAAGMLAGVDDTPLGTSALAETPLAAVLALPALRAPEPAARAAAWNVVAMASGPGESWIGGPALTLDDDPYVRFYQYKALGRQASQDSLGALGHALVGEEEPLLAELARDSIASGGTGVARRPSAGGGAGTPANASAPTNGSTTSP
jgi:hypothetical protein